MTDQPAGPDARRRLGHRAELDGIRALAVLMVCASHFVDGATGMGAAGVTLFFALSGFLITTLLVDEAAETGGIHLGRFYARRALRLLPALLVMVTVVVVLPLDTTVVDGLIAITYAANLFAAAGRSLHAFTHVWSLAVEEQFYVVWPLVMWKLRRARALLPILVAVTALAIGWRLVAAAVWRWDAARIVYGTDTRIDAILAGCALAALLSRHRFVASWAVGIAGTILLGVASASTGASLLRWGLPAGTIGAAALVAFAATRSAAILRRAPAVWVGKRSYAIYLWHYPMFVLGGRFDSTVVHIVVSAVLTLAATFASYELVERPFLRLKARFARRPASTSVDPRAVAIAPLL